MVTATAALPLRASAVSAARQRWCRDDAHQGEGEPLKPGTGERTLTYLCSWWFRSSCSARASGSMNSLNSFAKGFLLSQYKPRSGQFSEDRQEIGPHGARLLVAPDVPEADPFLGNPGLHVAVEYFDAARSIRLSNLVNRSTKANLTVPSGPLRCLPMMISATLGSFGALL